MIVLCRQSLKRSVEHGDSQVCECLHIQSHRSHLSVGEVEVVTHFHRQRSPAAAAEVHDAVLAASMRHVVDCEHSLTRRVPLRKTKGKKKAWVYTRKKYSTKRFMIFPTLNWVRQEGLLCVWVCVFSPLWVWSCQCWGCCCPCFGSPVCGVSFRRPSPRGPAWRHTVTMGTATRTTCGQST